MSDVNIAVELLIDAVDDAFDTAIVISGDSDLSTPIQRVLSRYPGKRIIVAFPPQRTSARLKKITTRGFNISPDKLRRSLLPDSVTTPKGIVMRRPSAWT